jgi:hypothetical protein
MSDEIWAAAQSKLGRLLPASLRVVLEVRNGGYLQRGRFPFQGSSWAPDHFKVLAMMGCGYDDGLDGQYGSRYLVSEWGFPEVGVVFALMAGGFYECVMLDYVSCGDSDEPCVSFVNEDRAVHRVAASLEEFLAGLC